MSIPVIAPESAEASPSQPFSTFEPENLEVNDITLRSGNMIANLRTKERGKHGLKCRGT